jgi:hypothetical protein
MMLGSCPYALPGHHFYETASARKDDFMRLRGERSADAEISAAMPADGQALPRAS